MTTNSHAGGQPKEVLDLANAIMAVGGVTDVEIGKTYLPDVRPTDLSLPIYADLPIASLRRSNGGLPNELLLSVEFRIERNNDGLNALEFLSWWVRDLSRGGEIIQIRSIGLPPLAGNAKQLGETLRFCIDWFYQNPSEDLSAVLGALTEKANSLNRSLAHYEAAF